MLMFAHGRPINFNPRSREGSDVCGTMPLPPISNFNPRSREGSDQIEGYALVLGVDFNPRSREGSDVARQA